jgi:hypothetical protein
LADSSHNVSNLNEMRASRPPGSIGPPMKQIRPTIIGWPEVICNSGGRIRTSDLRVMSVIDAQNATAEFASYYVQPRDLRTRAVLSQVYHVTHVCRSVGYKIGYIFLGLFRTDLRVAATTKDGSRSSFSRWLLATYRTFSTAEPNPASNESRRRRRPNFLSTHALKRCKEAKKTTALGQVAAVGFEDPSRKKFFYSRDGKRRRPLRVRCGFSVRRPYPLGQPPNVSTLSVLLNASISPPFNSRLVKESSCCFGRPR